MELGRLKRNKHQIANKVLCPPAGKNDQNPKQSIWSFEIGIWSLFGICDLGFKIYPPCTLLLLVRDGRRKAERQVQDHRQY